MIVYVCKKKTSTVFEPLHVMRDDPQVAIDSAMMYLRKEGVDTSGLFGLAVIDGGKNAVQKV